MKLQFSTASLLLTVAFVSIWAGGSLTLLKEGWRTDVEWPFLAWLLLDLSPAWIPFAFLGYMIGRRTITAKTLVLFAVTEIISIGVMLWIQGHLSKLLWT
jgi:hypothetical protein